MNLYDRENIVGTSEKIIKKLNEYGFRKVAMQSSKMGREEKECRQEAEDKLKENDDKVYKPPRGMNPRVAKIYLEF